MRSWKETKLKPGSLFPEVLFPALIWSLAKAKQEDKRIRDCPRGGSCAWQGVWIRRKPSGQPRRQRACESNTDLVLRVPHQLSGQRSVCMNSHSRWSVPVKKCTLNVAGTLQFPQLCERDHGHSGVSPRIWVDPVGRQVLTPHSFQCAQT